MSAPGPWLFRGGEPEWCARCGHAVCGDLYGDDDDCACCECLGFCWRSESRHSRPAIAAQWQALVEWADSIGASSTRDPAAWAVHAAKVAGLVFPPGTEWEVSFKPFTWPDRPVRIVITRGDYRVFAILEAAGGKPEAPWSDGRNVRSWSATLAGVVVDALEVRRHEGDVSGAP